MSSPSRGRSIRSIPSTTVFRLMTSRATTRCRPKPRSWRVRCIARSAAFRISSASERRSSPDSSAASRKSQNPRMIIIMLLRSWATPPANRPTASIFCACRTCCSASIRWVMSRPTPTMPATSPRAPRSGESVVCMCRVPRRDSRVHSYVTVSPASARRLARSCTALPSRPTISAVLRPRKLAGWKPSRWSHRPKTSTQRWSRSSRKTTSSIDSTRVRNRSSAAWMAASEAVRSASSIWFAAKADARSSAADRSPATRRMVWAWSS